MRRTLQLTTDLQPILAPEPLRSTAEATVNASGVILVSSRNSAFTLETLAFFPEKYFLENLAVRADGSILVTAMNTGELWCVPRPNGAIPVAPVLVATLDNLPMGIVEIEPDIFYICTLVEPTLERLDMRGWIPGAPVNQERVLSFPAPAKRLNGACLIGPNVLAIADCAAGLIWRVDLADGGRLAKARVWLRDDNMAPGRELQEVATDPKVVIHFPGVNGVRFAAKSSYLYYTSSAQDLFVRVPVDPGTYDPAGPPEIIASGFHAADDFCLDEQTGVAFIGTHITNTIQRVSLRATASAARDVVVGEPFTDKLVGPSSLVWAREDAEHGRVAYITTDGGFLRPAPDGVVRPAALLRFTIADGPTATDQPC